MYSSGLASSFTALVVFLTFHISYVIADQSWITDYDAFNAGVYGDWPVQTYQSSDIISPHFLVNKWNASAISNASHIFMSPTIGGQDGTPFIFSSKDLSLVYADTEWHGGSDTTMQIHGGKPYMTFWAGHDYHGHGTGSGVMLNSSYHMEHNLTVLGLDGGADSHEFQLTNDGAALINNYHTELADLRSVGQSKAGKVLTCSFQEVDIETGWVRFAWNSVDHFDFTEVRVPYDDNEWGWDWFHMNSLQKTRQGNYLISSRHLCMVALINGTDGSKVWQIGGNNNNFTDLSNGTATNICNQHHARFIDEEETEITLFDNQAWIKTAETPLCTKDCSRGVRLKINETDMTVKLLNSFYHPQSVQSWAEGGVHALENGNFMVGYGTVPAFVEFTETGEVAMDVQTRAMKDSGRGVDLYRVYKLDWVAQPSWKPTLVIKNQIIYVSWNGATEVDKWVLYGGNSPEKMEKVAAYHKMGFETAIRPFNTSTFYKIAGVDKHGNTLDTSEIVEMYTLRSPILFDIPDNYLVAMMAFPFVWSIVVIAYMAVTHQWFRLPRRSSPELEEGWEKREKREKNRKGEDLEEDARSTSKLLPRY